MNTLGRERIENKRLQKKKLKIEEGKKTLLPPPFLKTSFAPKLFRFLALSGTRHSSSSLSLSLSSRQTRPLLRDGVQGQRHSFPSRSSSPCVCVVVVFSPLPPPCCRRRRLDGIVINAPSSSRGTFRALSFSPNFPPPMTRTSRNFPRVGVETKENATEQGGKKGKERIGQRSFFSFASRHLARRRSLSSFSLFLSRFSSSSEPSSLPGP